jgi:hypothetical protein
MTALVFDVWPAIAAGFGFAIAAYAAMETDVDDIKRRAAFGIGGIAMMSVGILLI